MSEKTEKEALRDEIVAYTDELLSYAIKMDVDAIPNDPEQITVEYQNLLHRIIPKIGKIMTGINLLYFADESRANARLRQYFEAVQKIPNINDRLDSCFMMLRCLGVGAAFPIPMYSSPA